MFQEGVNKVADKITEIAVMTGSESIAHEVAFDTGMVKDVVNGLSDAFKAGDAVGACKDMCRLCWGALKERDFYVRQAQISN